MVRRRQFQENVKTQNCVVCRDHSQLSTPAAVSVKTVGTKEKPSVKLNSFLVLIYMRLSENNLIVSRDFHRSRGFTGIISWRVSFQHTLKGRA